MIKTIVIMMGLFLLYTACAPKLVPSPGVAPPIEVKPYPAKAAWEVEWDKTLQTARKEGTVVIYGLAIAPTMKQVAPSFYKKFGISLEVTPMERAPLLTQKIFSERNAGLYLVDIVFAGTTSYFTIMKPAGILDSLEPFLIIPEVLNTNNWYGGKLRWIDTERMVFLPFAFPNSTLAVNTDLVKPTEIKSYFDILEPKWKGKILMNDPTIAGVGLKSFGVLAFGLLNLDFFRQLAKQEPMIIWDQRLQVDWLAKGKYYILLAPRPAPMTEYKMAGAPVAYVPIPKEGTYLSAGNSLHLANKAPHPNASKIFINWFLSREGQAMVSPLEGQQSARVDVPAEGIDPLLTRQPGAKYFLDSDTEAWLKREPEFTKAAKEIFGHLVR